MTGTTLCQPDVQRNTNTHTHMLYEADFMHPLKSPKQKLKCRKREIRSEKISIRVRMLIDLILGYLMQCHINIVSILLFFEITVNTVSFSNYT